MANELRQRTTQIPAVPELDAGAGFAAKSGDEPHPAGPIKHGVGTQTLRIIAFILYVVSSLVA